VIYLTINHPGIVAQD